ncbi:MAG: hydrogenase maturation protease [Gammaproteobacteria bacterium]|nr:hydrogenase maturation protease [Gammaproteobacteria bacterium]
MKTLIVGLGSPHGDDRVGWQVIDVLAESGFALENRRLFRSNATAMDWIAEIKDSQQIVFVDGVKGRGKIGEVVVLTEDELPNENLAGSSHAISFAESVALMRKLFSLSIPIHFVGVEIGDSIPFSGVSVDVAQAIPSMVSAVEKLSKGASYDYQNI